nr:hypothetical protein [Tanacetum cinerariifolium]
LPVKSVVRCRSVSKIWKSLIDSSEFITSYHTCQTQPQHHLLVRCWLANNYEENYVSIVEDDTFPSKKSSLTVPQPVRLLKYILTVNSINGLLCFYGLRQHVMDNDDKMAVLWNPSVEKAVGIPISNSLRSPDGHTFIGFGVCPNTSDIKLVRINTNGYPAVLNWETQPQHHLLVRCWLANNYEGNYVSIVDDDTFPSQKSSLTVPQPVRLLKYILTVNSINGLLCFYGLGQHVMDNDDKMAVIWNPSVEKAVGIPISNSLRSPDGHAFIGFGVCPNTSDIKLVRINTIGYPTVLNWEVEVFTLSTRVWKSVSNIPPAFRTCQLTYDFVFVEGFIYWHVYDYINLALGIKSSLIISFDLKSDEFGYVSLPSRLVRMNKFTISKVNESLGLFEYYNEGETRFCDVWIMKEGVAKSFTKMLSIKAPDTWVHYQVLEIRKNGEVIIENIDDIYSSKLEVYEPVSGRISGIEINGLSRTFSVNSYMETLLLLDE